MIHEMMNNPRNASNSSIYTWMLFRGSMMDAQVLYDIRNHLHLLIFKQFGSFTNARTGILLMILEFKMPISYKNVCLMLTVTVIIQ